MRKFILFLSFMVFFIIFGFSALTIQSINTNDFPIMELKLSGEKLNTENIEVIEENEIPGKIISVEKHTNVINKPIDIVMIVDNSGTMEPKIQYVLSKTEELLNNMSEQGYDVRFGVLGFGSKVNVEFKSHFSHFTRSISETKNWLNRAATYRGGKDECQIEALRVASNYDFREYASKLLILFTDEDTTQNEVNMEALPELKKNIIDKNIIMFNFYSDPDPVFSVLVELSGGNLFQFNGEDFTNKVNEMFSFYEYYTSIEYLSYLSFPDYASKDLVTVKVRNKDSNSSVTKDYPLPQMNFIEEMDIISVDTKDFATVTAVVSVETSKKERINFFTINEDGKMIDPISIESLGEKRESEVDILFVLDTTASMIQELDAMVENLLEFTEILTNSNIKARIGLITFGDEIRIRKEFTEDFDYIKYILTKQNADGGGDVPEIPLDAAIAGLSMEFRRRAQKFLILITDARPHYYGDNTGFSQTTVEGLKEKFHEIGASLILVTPENINEYEELSREIPGDFYDIKIKESFGDIMNKIAVEISSQYKIKYVSPDTRPGTKRLLAVAHGTVGATTNYMSPYIKPPKIETKRFEINSTTAKPFIVKPGDITTLRCTVYTEPEGATDITFEWIAEAGEIIETNHNTAKWKSPEETGYVSIFVLVTSGEISKKAEVVVLVCENPCF
ncbi:MAG: VWA domain-containing protein [Kosmotogaceae bacterium]